MTVAWDTVNHHDGYIEVQSTEGQGTVISVFLPITDKCTAKVEALSTREDISGNGERILVVDDVAEQREIATAIFNELGYETKAVQSGESALEYLNKHHVDLLLLDMVMDPGMDGLETFKHVLFRQPNQKAVVASGYTKNERVQAAMQLGAAFVHKPYSLEEIARTVKHKLHGEL